MKVTARARCCYCGLDQYQTFNRDSWAAQNFLRTERDTFFCDVCHGKVFEIVWVKEVKVEDVYYGKDPQEVEKKDVFGYRYSPPIIAKTESGMMPDWMSLRSQDPEFLSDMDKLTNQINRSFMMPPGVFIHHGNVSLTGDLLRRWGQNPPQYFQP